MIPNTHIRKDTGRKSLRATLMLIFALFIGFTSLAKTGEEIFNSTCNTCHAPTEKRMVGPGLKGITERRDIEWIRSWIRNSQEMVAAGDSIGVALFEEYFKSPMPGYPDFTDAEIDDLLKYIAEAGSASDAAAAGGGTPAAGGGTGASGATGWPINLTAVLWGIVLLSVCLFFAYRFRTRMTRQINALGYFTPAHYVRNYAAIFFLYLIVAATLIYILVALLTAKTGMINTVMFMIFPYLAFGIFLVGSIYRYMRRGFQVSSLSTQFLEGKQLFRGSQPFHWGILVLFFGHLIAFLFPSAVLAWNGMPVRLLILEGASFAFGLSALYGLIMLIKRRLSSKLILVVTNRMDMVVYTILLVQIVSGLGVAFFVRWGSSWFSSVLTPYLRSVFSFNPDITAVSEMPWWIQLHIISAFAIIAIIPFTRFVHFLVAPVDYIWRRYQLVIWNWNRKAIRNSTKHTFGKGPRNH